MEQAKEFGDGIVYPQLEAYIARITAGEDDVGVVEVQEGIARRLFRVFI